MEVEINKCRTLEETKKYLNEINNRMSCIKTKFLEDLGLLESTITSINCIQQNIEENTRNSMRNKKIFVEKLDKYSKDIIGSRCREINQIMQIKKNLDAVNYLRKVKDGIENLFKLVQSHDDHVLTTDQMVKIGDFYEIWLKIPINNPIFIKSEYLFRKFITDVVLAQYQQKQFNFCCLNNVKLVFLKYVLLEIVNESFKGATFQTSIDRITELQNQYNNPIISDFIYNQVNNLIDENSNISLVIKLDGIIGSTLKLSNNPKVSKKVYIHLRDNLFDTLNNVKDRKIAYDLITQFKNETDESHLDDFISKCCSFTFTKSGDDIVYFSCAIMQLFENNAQEFRKFAELINKSQNYIDSLANKQDSEFSREIFSVLAKMPQTRSFLPHEYYVKVCFYKTIERKTKLDRSQKTYMSLNSFIDEIPNYISLINDIKNFAETGSEIYHTKLFPPKQLDKVKDLLYNWH